MVTSAGTTRREPVVYDSEGQQVYAVLHRPVSAEPPYPAVAIFHGLVGSKVQPHRLYVMLSEELARTGVASLRIDFRGRGDSEGETIDMTPDADIADATGALDLLAAHPEIDAARLGLLGHSWGGVVAAVLAGRDQRVGPVVLWNAAADVHTWDPPMEEYGDRRAFELFGNLIGEGFYAGVRSLFPREELTRGRGPVLIAQSTEDEASGDPIGDAGRLRDALAGAGVPHELRLLEGLDHAFMSHHAEREVIDLTREWLPRAFAPRRDA